ncbi:MULTISPECIES: basic amino acid ABC transporter substrate-binding protein [Aeribacillus]|jgi:glutamine transport system substrate-binding protein|uniref:basic amino acid ABC transporter substrate-binding protein n=1 Tax=Aeribacillus TaxID=1055323 RepID=UPI000E3545E7|nr:MULTISPECIES: basic amino acid ABC transporter substrate-binding protein [Aeribacillus]MDR9796902.1 basic amino acid ABC transporter substrate-binding protein [Aeribacillus pallidus]MED1441364.1 basic amino acid ABC transporter substrate-binding protein [Aeribacillus composti]RZI52737.1 basic amino acid ABC transporter substrate-binding protein [Aeribacillus pallidus]
MKKYFSKIIALAVFTSLMLILSACGAGGSEGDKGESSEKKETLKVVTNAAYAPFEYIDKGKVVGFDIDFINAVAKEAGYKVDIKHTGWDPMFAEVQRKQADLAASSVSITEDRKQTYDFSVPYFESTLMILVPEDSDIQNALDLKGKKVAVQNGTTGQTAAEKILAGDGTVKKFEDNVLAIMELLNGGADAVVADNAVVNEYIKNNPDKKLKAIKDPENFDSEFYGLMFAKGSKLKPELDKAINTLFENGTYSEIYKKWFGVEPDIDILKNQQ